MISPIRGQVPPKKGNNTHLQHTSLRKTLVFPNGKLDYSLTSHFGPDTFEFFPRWGIALPSGGHPWFSLG